VIPSAAPGTGAGALLERNAELSMLAKFLEAVEHDARATARSAPRHAAQPAGLTPRELEVLALLAGVLSGVEERPGRRRLLGLALGFVGVLVVVGRGVGAGQAFGSLAVLGGAACYGTGFVYTRRFLSGRPESGTVLAAIQVTLATLVLGAVTPLLGGLSAWRGPAAAAALLMLGALGTGVGYILNFAVIRAAGATVASTVTYVIPLW
jgi:drug/metabolite transporter (DMT)-like permease